jgi:hypothetical protein
MKKNILISQGGGIMKVSRTAFIKIGFIFPLFFFAFAAVSAGSVRAASSCGSTGSINAGPNPCAVAPGSLMCTSDITWNTSNASDPQVFVDSYNATGQLLNHQLFASQPSCFGVSCIAGWIGLGDTYTFNLTDTCNGVVATLGSVTVAAQAQAPQISVSPSSLTFSVAQGSTPASAALTITNGGTAPLNWTAESGSFGGGAQISASPVNGALPAGASTSTTISVTGASSLSPGTSAANLVIQNTNQPSQSTQIPAMLVVSASGGGTNPPPSDTSLPPPCYTNQSGGQSCSVPVPSLSSSAPDLSACSALASSNLASDVTVTYNNNNPSAGISWYYATPDAAAELSSCLGFPVVLTDTEPASWKVQPTLNIVYPNGKEDNAGALIYQLIDNYNGNVTSWLQQFAALDEEYAPTTNGEVVVYANGTTAPTKNSPGTQPFSPPSASTLANASSEIAAASLLPNVQVGCDDATCPDPVISALSSAAADPSACAALAASSLSADLEQDVMSTPGPGGDPAVQENSINYATPAAASELASCLGLQVVLSYGGPDNIVPWQAPPYLMVVYPNGATDIAGDLINALVSSYAGNVTAWLAQYANQEESIASSAPGSPGTPFYGPAAQSSGTTAQTTPTSASPQTSSAPPSSAQTPAVGSSGTGTVAPSSLPAPTGVVTSVQGYDPVADTYTASSTVEQGSDLVISGTFGNSGNTISVVTPSFLGGSSAGATIVSQNASQIEVSLADIPAGTHTIVVSSPSGATGSASFTIASTLGGTAASAGGSCSAGAMGGTSIAAVTQELQNITSILAAGGNNLSSSEIASIQTAVSSLAQAVSQLSSGAASGNCSVGSSIASAGSGSAPIASPSGSGTTITSAVANTVPPCGSASANAADATTYLTLDGNFPSSGNTVSVNGAALPAGDVFYQGPDYRVNAIAQENAQPLLPADKVPNELNINLGGGYASTTLTVTVTNANGTSAPVTVNVPGVAAAQSYDISPAAAGSAPVLVDAQGYDPQTGAYETMGDMVDMSAGNPLSGGGLSTYDRGDSYLILYGKFGPDAVVNQAYVGLDANGEAVLGLDANGKMISGGPVYSPTGLPNAGTRVVYDGPSDAPTASAPDQINLFTAFGQSGAFSVTDASGTSTPIVVNALYDTLTCAPANAIVTPPAPFIVQANVNTQPYAPPATVVGNIYGTFAGSGNTVYVNGQPLPASSITYQGPNRSGDAVVLTMAPREVDFTATSSVGTSFTLSVSGPSGTTVPVTMSPPPPSMVDQFNTETNYYLTPYY